MSGPIRRVTLVGVVLFAILVLRQQTPAPTPVSADCMPPPGRALGAAGRIAAHVDQRAIVTLTDPVGVHVADGTWVIVAADRSRVRVFRVEGGGLVWSATELPAESADA